MGNKKKLIIYFLSVIALLLLVFTLKKNQNTSNSNNNSLGGLEKTEINYGIRIDELSKEFDISASYLKALITLECSGRINVPPRFEKHVYEKLKEVRSKKRKKYEAVTHSMLKNASDDALKNLAKSWGPFQLMGYKCILLGIHIHDLRGDNSLFWGVKWINLTYGKYLRKEKYKDAFHIHNTGTSYPRFGKVRTHDPEYVDKGLSYMEYFDGL